jgi:hypothetical protein
MVEPARVNLINNKKRWFIFVLIAVSVMSALVEGLYYWHGVASKPATTAFANLFSAFLLALWVDADSQNHPEVKRPFEYGYLVLIFWLPYLPYYLWRTRGAKGIFNLIGFVGLFLLGDLVRLAIYYLAR